MAALTINGITVPLVKDSLEETYYEAGERARAFSGRGLVTVRARKRIWSGQIVTADATEAAAWRGLLRGDGQGWFCDEDGFYSEKGLGPNPGHPATRDVGGGWVGSGMLLPAGVGNTITFPAAVGSTWTALFSRLSPGEWFQYVQQSSGPQYRNGNAGTYDTTCLVVSAAGSPTFNGKFDSGDGYAHFDDLSIYPFLWPAAWAAAPYNYYPLGRAWPKAPFLEASGDLLDGATVTVRGKVAKSKPVDRGSAARIQRIDFTLEED